MSKSRNVFACALIIPFLAAAVPAMAQAQKQAAPQDGAETAKRAQCFAEAQAAVQKLGPSAEPGAKNTTGSSAYHQCAQKAGIKP